MWNGLHLNQASFGPDILLFPLSHLWFNKIPAVSFHCSLHSSHFHRCAQSRESIEVFTNKGNRINSGRAILLASSCFTSFCWKRVFCSFISLSKKLKHAGFFWATVATYYYTQQWHLSILTKIKQCSFGSIQHLQLPWLWFTRGVRVKRKQLQDQCVHNVADLTMAVNKCVCFQIYSACAKLIRHGSFRSHSWHRLFHH